MKKLVMLLSVVSFVFLAEASCCKKACGKVNKAVKHIDDAAAEAKRGCDENGCKTCEVVHKKLTKCSLDAQSTCTSLNNCYKNNHSTKTKKSTTKTKEPINSASRDINSSSKVIKKESK